ncbi:hypothetical protein ACU610_03250 [Geodermatophilus sp. URMC 61]|uniref:hypothetical protein n=1 Tax=Geodermatophilus sp. URMC 61 TaxID=3423411 RepID=UPI00406CE22E
MEKTARHVLLATTFGAALAAGLVTPGMAQAEVAPYDCGWDYDWDGDGDRDRDDYDWWYDRHRYHDYHEGDDTREECEE